ncbi:hypothetical protein GCM10010205_15540 [Streptomyces nojiriensis]|nr:hypothetical protein GCM10010205_15540 [Streptomyces nojiriensis]
MTVTVPPEPPEPPGSVPHPAMRHAPIAVATKVRERDATRREKVMSMHHSAPPVTVE